MSEDAFTQQVAEEGLPTPHWEEALVGNVYISFVDSWLQSGMVTLSLGCRSQAGIFFVRKRPFADDRGRKTRQSAHEAATKKRRCPRPPRSRRYGLGRERS